jgi:phosphoribosylanthranilate isomerase
VKICGITRGEDALAAAAFGADAVGFVFHAKSPRAIDPVRAAAIVATLPPFVTPVGVFVDATAEEMIRIAAAVKLRCLQLHGSEPPALASALPLPVIKAFRTSRDLAVEEILRFHTSAVLIDGFREGSHGGTGTLADWTLAARAARLCRLVLSGGLQPGNVGAAIGVVSPYAVDVSSGVERSPGVKDHGLMAAFIRAAKAQPAEDAGVSSET